MRPLLSIQFAVITAVVAVSGCATNAQSVSHRSAPIAKGNAPAVFVEADEQPKPNRVVAPTADEASPIKLVGQIEDVSDVTVVDSDSAWWKTSIAGSLRQDAEPVQVSVEDLLVRSLQHSSQVKVFSELPLIRETSVVEADSAFDWHGFLDSRWDDISDPVGNNLTVGGGQTRFNDHNFSTSVGARKRTRSGGQFEMAQRFGWQDNNSTFFVPDQQGTSRLVLSYTHPLMRGRGKIYNNSLKVLACIDSDIAKDEFQRQLQSHLLEVVRAYWGLYLERGVYAQKLRASNRAQEVYDRLQRRSEIDAFESQLISAEAEVKSRRSDLKRSLAAVKNAEDRVRSLVNDPALDNEYLELIPVDSPTSAAFPVTMDEALATAVQQRPEVNQALKQIKAAAVRVNMSKNELMPALNLVTETYLSGLQQEGNVGRAWPDQFSVGAPSYSIGLQYEVPLGNRAARSRHTRRSLELRQLQNQYATTVQTLKLETRVAVREVETSYDELDTKLSALNAMKSKSDYILRRWELMPGQGRSGSYVLEDLLAAQSQLARAENEYLASVVTYNLALMNLKRATGMLLQHEQVTTGRACVNGLPTQILDKPNLGPNAILPETIAPGEVVPAFEQPAAPYYDEGVPVVPQPATDQPVTPWGGGHSLPETPVRPVRTSERNGNATRASYSQ